MRRLFEKYTWLNTCTGVELQVMGEDLYSCRTCTVSLNKAQLHIGQKEEITGNLQTILKKLPADQPLAVTLTGKSTLIKQTAKLEQVDRESLSQVFPNLDLPQFYIQNFLSGEQSFVSIIRKEIVDVLIDALKKNSVTVLSLSLGPFVVSNVLNQLNIYGENVQFDGHSIELKENNWLKYTFRKDESAKFPVKIDIETIDEKFILAYATAFQLALYNRINPVVVPVEIIQSDLNVYRTDKKFKLALTIVLASFFILLLFNFFIFSWYQAENVKLSSQVSQSTAGMDSIRRMETRIKEDEAQLQELGWNGGTSYAWISDQLGQSIPSSIKLDRLTIHPAKEDRSNTVKKVVYDIGAVKIAGHSPSIQAVNEWIYILRAKDWIKEVDLKSFDHAEETEEEPAENFVLLVRY